MLPDVLGELEPKVDRRFLYGLNDEAAPEQASRTT